MSEDFSVLRAGAGTQAQPDAGLVAPNISAAFASGKFSDITRGIHTFDTSPLTQYAVISAATLTFTYSAHSTALGTTEVYAVSASPASNSNLVTADFTTLGSTSFGNANIQAGDMTITLSASGIATISKTGITRFGTREGHDFLNVSPTWSWPASTYYEYSGAFSPGTNGVKLAITYTLVYPYGYNGLEGLKGNVLGSGIEDWVRIRTHTVNEDRLTGQMFLDWTNWAVAEVAPKAYHNNDYLTPSVLGVGTSFNLSSLKMRRIEKVVDATNGLIVPASASDFEISLPSVDSNTAYWTQHGETLSISYGANLTGGSVTVYYHKVPHYMTSRADRLNIHDSYVPMILDKVANQVEDWKRFNNWKPS